jgi:hypothetical protein
MFIFGLKYVCKETIKFNRDIFIFDGGNKRLRNVTNCIVSVKFLTDVRDFDRNAANWQ